MILPLLSGWMAQRWVVVFAVGVAWVTAGGCAQESSSGSLSTTTTVVRNRPSSTTTTTTNPGDDVADDPVIARGAPEVAPPPADLAPDALEVETLIEGTGVGAAVGDQVTVHYVLVLADGEVVDESWSRGEPFTVVLGQGTVIPGWEQGLIGAKEGERRRLVLGSDLAYGDQGTGPIPPGASLAFVVDIIAVSP